MIEGIDFTDCRVVLGKAYNGANGKKIAVEYNGTLYMLKFPPSGKNKPTELSYTNSCFSEHIASSIFNLIGVKAHETLLGTFKVGGKEKIVCACKDFTADGKRFFDFCSIKNTILESDSNGTGTELEDILDTIEKQRYVPSEELEKYFWDVFAVDALLGNFDRHNGNWGFLFDDSTGEASLAPIYDCGSCLLPQADERIMNEVLTNEDALNARIYQYPTSAIKQNGRKINYRDFLMSAEYEGCNKAVKRIVPRINFDKLGALIDEAPYLSEMQRKFYMHYIKARYDRILAPALDLAVSLEQEQNDSVMGVQQADS
ncbi:MAG: HipA domain-containing protein [Butyrivibrio sp.]|nr:HipA domain-containing protein [Butyrivibrio sp.]